MHDRLLPYTTLREYVMRAITPDLDHLTYDENYDQFQAFRHRWLQHLCEEIMNAKQCFDKVVKHLLTQKRRSEGKQEAALIAAKMAICALWAA